MVFKDAEKKIDELMYPAKSSPVKDEESRQAISLAYEALKIVDGISERFREFPQEIQDAFMDFRMRQSESRSNEVNDYAYRFVTETMDEIEFLEDDEKEHEIPC